MREYITKEEKKIKTKFTHALKVRSDKKRYN